MAKKEIRNRPDSYFGTTYKCKALQAAKDLHYSRRVIQRIEDAKTDAEITRIMVKARKDSYDD